MKYLLVFIFFLGACVSKPVALPEGPRTLLFPFGTYQHLVQLKLTKAPAQGPQSFEFRGVFVYQKGRMKLVALTPFGTTLFRAEEDFISGEIKIEAYVDALKKVEDKIRQSYISTREILTLPIEESSRKGLIVAKKNAEGLPLEMILKSKDPSVGDMQITVSDYDSIQIPKKIVVKSLQFQLIVKVLSYEF